MFYTLFFCKLCLLWVFRSWRSWRLYVILFKKLPFSCKRLYLPRYEHPCNIMNWFLFALITFKQSEFSRRCNEKKVTPIVLLTLSRCCRKTSSFTRSRVFYQSFIFTNFFGLQGLKLQISCCTYQISCCCTFCFGTVTNYGGSHCREDFLNLSYNLCKDIRSD